MTPAEARLEMTRVLDALVKARLREESLDQADTLRHDAPNPHKSALCVLLDHAEKAADRVMEMLANQAAGNDPNYQPPGRDGGPV